jgi:TorA maturation chaperone TorD
MSDYQPDESTARVDLLRFLSACYYEPTAEFAEEKLFDSIASATRQAWPQLAGLADELGQAFAEESLQTLLVDYTRLFLGPMKALASPYGASWLPTPMVGDEVLPPVVLDLYAEGGFEVDGELAELPDHMAIELEFLYLLSFNQRQADLLGNFSDFEAMSKLRARFLDEHLAAWISPFTQAVKEHAETAFYRALADLTQGIIRLELVWQGGD